MRSLYDKVQQHGFNKTGRSRYLIRKKGGILSWMRKKLKMGMCVKENDRPLQKRVFTPQP